MSTLYRLELLRRIFIGLFTIIVLFWFGFTYKAFAASNFKLSDLEIPWNTLFQAVTSILGAIIVFILNKLHKSTNSKMDKLLALTAQAAKAEGVLEEKARGRKGRGK